MIKQAQRRGGATAGNNNNLNTNQVSNKLDLNIKDENRNSLLHHLFMNFSTNMEQNVELCQQLLKQNELQPKGVLRLSEINKQGATPIDLAIDLKQN